MKNDEKKEVTVNGVYQVIGYLSIKRMPLSEAQLEASRQLVAQIEKGDDE